MTVRSFLLQQGLIQPHDTENGQGQFRMQCPHCKHHNNKCYIDARGKGVHCFHCGWSKTWRAFERMYEPPTPEEQAMESFLRNCETALWKDTDLLQYLRDRGLTDDTIKAVHLGYCDFNSLPPATPEDISIGLAKSNGSWSLQSRIVIPYIRDGYPIDFRGRAHPNAVNEKVKYLSLPGHSALPYYPSEVDKAHPVVITEGELDAVLLRQEGIQAIGVPGANVHFNDHFTGYRSLYLAYDADKAGADGRDKMLKGIPEIRRVDLPEGFDVSDYVQAFGIDSFNRLLERSVFYLYGKPQKEDKFSTVLEDFQNWSWTNGDLLGPKCGDWAPRLEKLLSGWQPGLILLGAEFHSGKSCFMVKAGYEAAMANPEDTIVVFLTLDDTMEEFMKRLVSLHTRIDFNLIASPRAFIANDPVLNAQYDTGMKSLKQINNIIVRDATYGRSLRYLRNYFESLRTKYPDKRIIVFTDSLAKITADGAEEDATEDGGGTKTNWKAYLASELKYLTTKHKICLVTPTDLRKMNGARRPTVDDLKDAVELGYEAQVICLMYNDLKRQGDDAILKYVPDGGTQEEPIVEMDFRKNKFTGKQDLIRYRMLGGISDFFEVEKSEDEIFTQDVNKQLASKKSP